MLRERAINLEERLVWNGSDALLGLADALRARVERGAWALEDRVVWPLRERVGGWSPPAPSRRSTQVAAAAVAALAVAAAVLLLVVSGGGSAAPPAPGLATQVASPAPSSPVKAAAPAKPAPVLHGAVPLFAPATRAAAKASRAAAQAKAPLAHRSEAATAADASSAATGAAPGQIAGPEAIAAARRFAKAFVLYETGTIDSGVRATFSATTTPRFDAALLHRPPRLPANVRVPRAKVLNVVAGPQLGDNATVSVSLLRLGLTSELRLSMHREKDGSWLVKEGLG